MLEPVITDMERTRAVVPKPRDMWDCYSTCVVNGMLRMVECVAEDVPLEVARRFVEVGVVGG